MKTTNVILSVIAVAVVIIASIVVHQWYEREQVKSYFRGVAEQEEIEEQKRLGIYDYPLTEQEQKEIDECYAKSKALFDSGNFTAYGPVQNECVDLEGQIKSKY